MKNIRKLNTGFEDQQYRCLLHRLPEVICVKKPGELGVDVHHVYITFRCVSDCGFPIRPAIVGLCINTEGSKDFEFEPGISLLILFLDFLGKHGK